MNGLIIVSTSVVNIAADNEMSLLVTAKTPNPLYSIQFVYTSTLLLRNVIPVVRVEIIYVEGSQ